MRPKLVLRNKSCEHRVHMDEPAQEVKELEKQFLHSAGKAATAGYNVHVQYGETMGDNPFFPKIKQK